MEDRRHHNLYGFAIATGVVGALGCGGGAQTKVEVQEPSNEDFGLEVAEAEPSPPSKDDPSDVHLVGDHLEIDQKIHFSSNSHEILEDSYELLDHIAQTLQNHADLSRVKVVGHTDSMGADQHNQQLSARRAEAVVTALKKRGAAQEFEAHGAGETEPLCKVETAECHEQNRRVEFVVEKDPQ